MPYALEQLFRDQEYDWVADAVAPVLAWVPGQTRASRNQPFRFEVEHIIRRKTSKLFIDLSWNEKALEVLKPGVLEHSRRLRTERSVQREHVVELAAYGLTLVAISIFLPGRRVISFRKGSAPDILLDVTPNALRGVEVAGRSRGGRASLKSIGRAKATQLASRPDLAEVHLSLWCASPRITIMEQLKP
jgi:hypothetical protein